MDRLKKLTGGVATVAAAALAAILAARPERYVPACFEGLALWATRVAPALLPFMIITLLLTKTGGAKRAAAPFAGLCRRVNLPQEAAAVFLMSVFSGYPAGSRILKEYAVGGLFDSSDVKKLAALCSTSGPMFILGSVGQGMFGDGGAGWAIMAAHLAAVLLTGGAICALSPKGGSRPALAPPQRDGGNILYDSFYSAVTSVAVAGAFICFFYTLAQVAQDLKLLYPLAYLLRPVAGQGAEGVCAGLIEATGGIAKLAAGGKAAVPFAGFLVTFGGASILAQQLCYLIPCGVNAGKFIGIKLAQGALCSLFLLPFALT